MLYKYSICLYTLSAQFLSVAYLVLISFNVQPLHYVPNAFSPGTSPGVNDEFRVVYKSLVKFSCWIFNRWGQLLYHWTDPAQGWDGKKGGKYVSPGVYFYVIEAEGSDGIKYKKKGDINILRPKTINDQINPDEGGGI